MNAGASSFVRVRYAADLLETAARPARRGLGDGALRAGRRPVGRGDVRAAPARRTSSASPTRSATRTTSPSGRCCCRASAGATASSRESRGSGSARSSAAWWPRRSTGSAGRRATTTPTRTRTLRGALLQGLGVLGADPNAEAAAREFEAESRAGKDVDPALAAASVNVVARHGRRPTTTSGSSDRSWPRRHAAGAAALPAGAAGRSAMPRCSTGRLRRCLDGDDPHPERALRAGVRDPQPRPGPPRLGRSCRRTGTSWTGRFPAALRVRMADGVRFLAEARGGPRTRRRSSRPIRSRSPPRSLEQILERQRVFAALRERAAPELAAHFAG